MNGREAAGACRGDSRAAGGGVFGDFVLVVITGEADLAALWGVIGSHEVKHSLTNRRVVR